MAGLIDRDERRAERQERVATRRAERQARRTERRESREAKRSERIARRDHKKKIKESYKAKRKSGSYSKNDQSFFKLHAKNKGMKIQDYYDKYVNYR
jgi:hypothetical protein